MKRRNFIRLSSSATALCFLDAHLLLSNTTCTAMSTPNLPRITTLQLLTTTPLEAMKKFYTQLIGFSLVLQRGNVWTGSGGKGQETDVFETKVTIRSEQALEWQLLGYPYQVVSAG